MKFVKMAWILGGMTAMGLGMTAQAGSSSSSSGSGSSSTAGGGVSCMSLASCCPKLTGDNATNCLTVVAGNDESSCATYLGEAGGSCAGTTSSVGTSVGGSSSIGTSVGGSSTVGTGSSSGTGTGGTSSSSCATASLFPETKPGVYCPFSGVDGGKAVTCAATDHCCEPPEVTGQTTPPSTCEPAATACPTTGSTNWGCLGPMDCSGATPVCCGSGTIGMDPGCTTAYVSAFTGTSCAASCTTFKVCETDSDCGAGSAAGTCQPAKAKGGQFGHCGS